MLKNNNYKQNLMQIYIVIKYITIKFKNNQNNNNKKNSMSNINIKIIYNVNNRHKLNNSICYIITNTC